MKPKRWPSVIWWLPSVLVVLPLAGLPLYWWDARRMVFARELSGGANPVSATRHVLRSIEPYLLNHGNFRPVGRLFEWLVIAFAYDGGEATGLPPHVLLGAVRLLMAGCIAVAATAIVRALMRSAGVGAGSLVSLHPLVLAALLVTADGGGGLAAFPHIFAGTVALILAVTLAVCRDGDLRRRPLRMREYVGMAACGVVAASFYDLAYLTPVLAATFVTARAWLAGIPLRDALATAAVRRWLAHAVGFLAVFVPTRAVIAAWGGDYAGSAVSVSTDAVSASWGRLWSGLAPFGWSRAGSRAGGQLGFADLFANSYIALAAAAIAATAFASARGAAGQRDAPTADRAAARLGLALAAFGAVTAGGASLIAGMSERMQTRMPALGTSWRETVLAQVGWSFMAASCLALLSTRRPLRVVVAGGLALAMMATLLANWQHADGRRSNERDSLTSMITAAAMLPADYVAANAARCHLVAGLSEETADETFVIALEALWEDRYGLRYCDPTAAGVAMMLPVRESQDLSMPPQPYCADETVAVLANAGSSADTHAAHVLAGALRTSCVIDADAANQPLPDAAASHLADIDVGWVIGGLLQVPDSKLPAGIEWRRIAGLDRWDTLRIIGEAARIIPAR